MNKKIKIITSIIFTLILISISSTAFATLHTSVNDGTTKHGQQNTTSKYSAVAFYPYNSRTPFDSSRTSTFYCGARGKNLRVNTISEGLGTSWDAGYGSWTIDATTNSADAKSKAKYAAMGVYIGNSGNTIDYSGDVYRAFKDRIQQYFDELSRTHEDMKIVAYKVANDEWGDDFPDDISNATTETQGKPAVEEEKEFLKRQLHAENTVVYYGKEIAGTTYYDKQEVIENKNNRLSYILSSGINIPSTEGTMKNYASTVSDKVGKLTDEETIAILCGDGVTRNLKKRDLIQYALWQDKAENAAAKGITITSGYAHNVGALPGARDKRYDKVGLYEEAAAYESFYNTYVKSGYNSANFSTTTTTVTVDRSARTYYVGPFKLNYQSAGNKFAYVENMWLVSGENTTTSFEIYVNGSKVDKYPNSGEEFYVKFNASSLNYPIGIKVKAQINYLQETYSKYVRMEGKGDKYVYYIQAEMITEKIGNTWNATVKATPGIKKIQEAAYDAQPNTYTIEADRTWGSTTVETTFTADLRMKIGGKVFLDVGNGKETTTDGIYTEEGEEVTLKDELMPRVEVSLYEVKMDDTQSYVTSKYTDNNGKYEFDNLNALSTYYVRFKYNGQYYEPTIYTSPTETENYQNTSNGTDYQADYNNAGTRFKGRQSLNEKFGTIYSYKANYNKEDSGYNETFTKEELLGYTKKLVEKDGKYKLESEKTREAVINEYGLLVEGIESSTDETTIKMVQYVKDCMTYSWTKNASDTIDTYPVSNSFTIGSDRAVYTSNQLDKSQFINQGYSKRQDVDIALMNDVANVTVEINDHTEDFYYNARTNPETFTMNLEERISEGYYDAVYSREIYPSDYEYKVDKVYGEYYGQYWKTIDNELKIYVTYKLTLKNHSTGVKTTIDEIVDYYDEEYTYVPERSFITLKKGEYKDLLEGSAEDRLNIGKQDSTRYPGTRTGTDDMVIQGYNKLYITGLDNTYLRPNQEAYVYVTFSVNKDANRYITLDEDPDTGTAIDVGKENIAEIRGYKTIYEKGVNIPNVGETPDNKIAGLVDVNSNPGNIRKAGITKNFETADKDTKYKIYAKFENDTDKAPNLILTIKNERLEYNARIISGYVWEDARNLYNTSQATATGNGIRDEGETLINGVTVQLVEVMENGTEYIWREFGSNITGTGTAGNGKSTGEMQEETPIININNNVKNYNFGENKKGAYAFLSFVPGKYIVRFVYGKNEKTVLPTNSEVTNLLGKSGLNAKSYNGHDYKSTVYQIGLDTYNEKNTSRQYEYDITKGDTVLASDAKDLYNIRQNVNAYSTKEVRNTFAEELASYMSVPEYNGVKYSKEKMNTLLNSFMSHTAMTAETGIIDMEVEYNTKITPKQTLHNVNEYHLKDLDLGLEERPKAQIEILKEISSVKVTLANGNVLFDATDRQENLAWIKPREYSNGVKYENNLMTPSRYETLENIRNIRYYELVQPTIDKEIMHGATLRITYKISAINTGEVDYDEEQFYYTGIAKNKNTLVTATPMQLVDYVPNNLKYYGEDNKSIWSLVSTENLVNGENNLVNINLKNNLDDFATKITTKKINSILVPEVYSKTVDTSKTYQTSVQLVLTQLLSAENKDGDLDYVNKVELVAESTSNGRKMAYSVVGNQDPTGDIKELDASQAETNVLPPFGAILTYIIISVIAIAGAIIIVLGIVFIKKKVLTK